MTEREAIKILISIRDYLCDGNPTWRTEPIHDAVNMAVDALRKTENCSEIPNNSTSSKMEQVDKDINVRSKDEPNCEECKHFHENAVMYLDQCDFCFKDCKYEPKDEPQPMTDAEITEFAKEIVHKMIDNSVIADDAYPDLRQRMHEAVERLDEYYPSEDERSDQ